MGQHWLAKSVGLVLFALSLAGVMTPAAFAASSKQAGHAATPFVVLCQRTTETDNIEIDEAGANPANMRYHSEGIIYYDIRRDASTQRPCSLQVVIRIFPSSSWSGSLDVYALFNGNDVPASYRALNNASTKAPGHLVFRGPWFGAGSGDWEIASDFFTAAGGGGGPLAYFTL